MSDQATQELQEYRIRLANGELEIVRGTQIDQRTAFDGPNKIVVYAGRELVGEFFAPLGWFKAPHRKLLGFEDGLNDALSSSWLSRSGPHVLEGYKRGWDVGAELHTFRAEKERLAEAAAIAALSVPEVAEVEIPEGFTKWEGGDCPVAPGTLVKVIHRDGDVLYSVAGDDYAADWTHCDGSGDIIAYRVLPIEPAAEAKGEDYLPEGFTRWSSDPHADRGPQPSGDMMVTAWMGGDDFVGPLPAKDFDWEHDTDPVLGYKIDTSGETQGTLTGSAEREASNAFPGGVEGSRETSPSSDEIAAWPITTSAPNHNTQETAQSLPPLFKPEPPQAATPEELMESGAIDGEAYWLSRKLAKVEA